MELILEHNLEDSGYVLISLYAKEFGTTALMQQKRISKYELPIIQANVEDYNERPWAYNSITIQMSKTIRDTWKEQDRQKVKQKPTRTPEEEARIQTITAKIKATKERNKKQHDEMTEYVKTLKEEAVKKNRNYRYEPSYCSSGLAGEHFVSIYVEPSMSDDCFGFGDIKVNQTLDDDIESLYAYYDDYIF